MINDMYILSLCFAYLILVVSGSYTDLETGETLPDIAMVMPTAVRPARDLMTLLFLYMLFIMFKLLRETTRAEFPKY